MAIDAYSSFFSGIHGVAPYEYQVRVAERLLGGHSICLRAPTGAGKTHAVLTPFLFPAWSARPARLIYALPLRSLAQQIYGGATSLAERAAGRSLIVTMQTGEQPDDPFFERGDIIVTTYDQVLSGLLDGPYGLSSRLHNVNSAALAGTLVVFDEFHLMEPARAFLTGAAGLHLFRDLCQSVWMTATATTPLADALHDALGCESVALSTAELAALPSLASVTRELRLEAAPLTAGDVLRFPEARSIVLLNTVERAQMMYEEIHRRAPDLPLFLLHARFFTPDRERTVEKLGRSFGRESRGPAILVSTQVVEAGTNISSDRLHTELCPMNSLAQRAGRNARFEGETGTVHVYPLPADERSWLPYGSLREPDPALARTEHVLRRRSAWRLTPELVAEWVEEVHRVPDDEALRGGWRGRLRECLEVIRRNALEREPTRVAHLIREEDTATIRVVVARPENLPANPSDREALAISRWAVRRLLDDPAPLEGGHPQGDAPTVGASPCGCPGWVWHLGDQPEWRPLDTAEQLMAAYVVCLRPEVARYTTESGLRLGLPGDQESAPRERPRRPGHRPLHAEAWADHARAVAAEAEQQARLGGADSGLLAKGLAKRFGLSPEPMIATVRAAGLTHDLGKLQERWQRWADASQRAVGGERPFALPLAHTDFDPGDPAARQRERSLPAKRPGHALAGAYWAGLFLAGLLPTIPEGELRAQVASACAAAVLAHHGGWLPDPRQPFAIPPMWPGWERVAAGATGVEPAPAAIRRSALHPDPRGRLEQLLDATTGPEALAEWWPLVAWLTRTLRLADQRATSEGD